PIAGSARGRQTSRHLRRRPPVSVRSDRKGHARVVRQVSRRRQVTPHQPMPDRAELFPAAAFPENRSGRLTKEQALRFERMVSGRRQSTRGLAVPVGAIGALLLIMSGPAATAVKRQLAGWGFVAAAAAILAAPAFDPLAADVLEGRVEAVEGAVGK